MSYGAYNTGGAPTAPSYSSSQSFGSQSYGNPYGRPQSPANPYGGPPPPSNYGSYGYGQPQQPSGWAGGAYPPAYGGGYQQPQVPSMFPPGTEQEIIDLFQRADVDRNGTVDAVELGRLLSSGRQPFSSRTVRLMLHLFSDNRNDTSRIGPKGFANLWRELKQWSRKFTEYDVDRSGTIDVNELQQALLSFYFAIPAPVLQMLVSKYDFSGNSRSIGYDNFIECGFIVKGLTEKFRDQDRNRVGSATFDYTTFMLMVIPFIAA